MPPEISGKTRDSIGINISVLKVFILRNLFLGVLSLSGAGGTCNQIKHQVRPLRATRAAIMDTRTAYAERMIDALTSSCRSWAAARA